MANIKISELEQISTVENDDILPIVDSSATETKKILLSQLREVTAYDTLPVGAEVDYDGETVPSGWTEVESYSTTEEVDTGKLWIDGKKIYRKVFTGTTPNSVTGAVDFNNEIDTLVSENLLMLSGSDYYVSRGYWESNAMQFSYTINKSTSVYFSTLSNTSRNRPFTLIIEYTKP